MNKTLLQKGIKRLAFALPLCFIGPVVVHQAFQNKTHALYIPVLLSGILLLALAFFYGLTGIKTLVNALLGKRKTNL